MSALRTVFRPTIAACVVALGLVAGLVGAGSAGAHEAVPGAQPHDTTATALGLDHLALIAAVATVACLGVAAIARRRRRRADDGASAADARP